MSKYVLSWASDDAGLKVSVRVYDTLEEAQVSMLSYWKDLLMLYELDEGCTEFDLDDETAYGAGLYGNIGDTWLSYRSGDGYGDEVRITEVWAC